MLQAGTYQNCTITKPVSLRGFDAAYGPDTDIVEHVEIRVQIDHTFKGDNEKETQKLIKQIPEVAKAVLELRKVGAKDDVAEGPNTFTVSIKRTFPAMFYDISRAGYPSVQFNGDVEGKPRVQIVDGNVAVRWKVSASIRAQQLATLGYYASHEDVELSLSDTQAAVPFVDVSSSQQPEA